MYYKSNTALAKEIALFIYHNYSDAMFAVNSNTDATSYQATSVYDEEAMSVEIYGSEAETIAEEFNLVEISEQEYNMNKAYAYQR
jgi:hypothetical protein